jgi:hypothetical protein
MGGPKFEPDDTIPLNSNSASPVRLAGKPGAGGDWRTLPQFTALSKGDQNLFTNYADNGNPVLLQSTRDLLCASIVEGATFQDAALQPTLLESLRKAPSECFGPMSNLLGGNASYSSPDLGRMSDKDVKNAQKRLMRIIGAIAEALSKAKTNDAKTILVTALDAYGHGAAAKMILVDSSDPQVQQFPQVGDLYYGGGVVGLNTVGFGITPDGISKPSLLAATAAHAHGHVRRDSWHRDHPTPKGSYVHFVDEIFAYYTEFLVTWDQDGRPSGQDMEKATDALLGKGRSTPYRYSQATGDEETKIKGATDYITLTGKGKDNMQKAPTPRALMPEGADWSILNE